jgi:hypothetical protein
VALFDFKNEYKDLYFPKDTTASIINVPEMRFIMTGGTGNPNSSPLYKTALELLFELSYSINFDEKSEGYFSYVIAPLEGMWSFENIGQDRDKDEFHWTLMIRQPDFVTEQVLLAAKTKLASKNLSIDISMARLKIFEEGLCAQIMHTGPYDDQAPTLTKLEDFIKTNGYITQMSGLRQHHEIYLSNPHETPAKELKTIIRHPIVKL